MFCSNFIARPTLELNLLINCEGTGQNLNTILEACRHYSAMKVLTLEINKSSKQRALKHILTVDYPGKQ